MNKQPSISVVVPTYNRRDSLKECINSLLTQSYQEYEIIVVNDGSTDGTDKLLEKYSRENPNLRFFTQSNRGPAAARNLGINNSKGEILCFTDDDCIADDDWVKNLVGAYADKTIGGVGGKIIAHEPKTLSEKYSEKSKFLDQEKLIKVMIVGANSSYKKNNLELAGDFNEYFRTSEDTEISINMQLKGFKLVYAPKAIVYHNHRSDVKGLFKQLYSYEKGYARLHKKYTKNFNPGRRILNHLYRLIRKIIITPFKLVKAFFVENSRFYVIEHFMDIVALVVMILGIIQEIIFGKMYTGEKINKKLDFIEKANLPGGWGL